MTNPEIDGIEHMLASGEMLPAQLAAPSSWSPEKRLAGAVLASALVGVRDHAGDERYAEELHKDLAWIHSDDTAAPFCFLRLCDLFDLDPAWVRARVECWRETGPRRGGVFSLRRAAA